MIILDKELEETLKMAAETEGLIKALPNTRIEKYRQLARAGYVKFKKNSMRMGTVYLTERGEAYLELLQEES